MTEAMTPGGDYDRHSAYQMRGGLTHVDVIAAAADRVVPSDERGSVVIADYGCAQGRVSNPLIRTAVDRIRRTDPDVPICVYHNDQLTNDWATLFERLQDADSYLHGEGGPITPLASATSFYDPVTPPGIVDLGLSFAALQWLAAPGPTTGGTALYFDQLDGPAAARMAERAHVDWTQLLARRADELAPGGRLVFDMMGVADDGVAAGHDVWQHVRAICEELAAEGRLDEDQLGEYVIPIYERSAAEVTRPFEEEIGERLHLESVDLGAVSNPYMDRYRTAGDAAAFARDFSGFVRAFSEPSLRHGLALTDETVVELYDRLETRLRDEVATGFSFDVHTLTLVISRIG